MGFFMDGLDAEAYDRQYTDRDLVRRVLGYFKPEAGRMALVAAAVALTTLAQTGVPIYISWALDQVQANPGGANILGMAGIMSLLAVAAGVFNAIRGWFSSQAVGNVVLRLREDAFDAIMRRDLSFYDQFPSGKIVSRITSDTQAFSQVVTLTIDLMSRILVVVVLLIYLATISFRLTLILLALAPFVFASALAFRRIARDTITQQRRVQAEVSNHIQETISGIGV